VSEAKPTIWPHDDLDELESAAFAATWRWMKKIEPFQCVRFGFVSGRMENLGRDLTQHLDADERARRSAKTRAQGSGRTLKQVIADICRDAERSRLDAMIEASASPDHPAEGW
jgi:hypothetical protein